MHSQEKKKTQFEFHFWEFGSEGGRERGKNATYLNDFSKMKREKSGDTYLQDKLHKFNPESGRVEIYRVA
jgi:hypothetical protein